MSSDTSGGGRTPFPPSKRTAGSAPDWFVKRRTGARPVVFGRLGETPRAAISEVPEGLDALQGFGQAIPPPGPAPGTQTDLAAAATVSRSKFPPPPGVPNLDTPVPGSKSAPPPPPHAVSPQALAEMEARTKAFAEAALDLAAAKGKLLQALEGQLLELSIEIARAIVEREVEADPELHAALAREALRSLGHPETATLRAAPEVVDVIRERYGDAVVELDGVKVRVQPDPEIEGLGCIAENEFARVDGRVAERLRAARRAMEDERRRRGREETE